MSRPFIVDTRFHSEVEIILRYAPTLLEGVLDVELAGSVSRSEGFRFFELPAYRGVPLAVLDETSRMKTGSTASLDACLTVALSRLAGYERLVFSSGGHLGTALADYAIVGGMDCYFFCPALSLQKLDGAHWERKGAHLIAVEGGVRRARQAAQMFADAIGLPCVPLLDWKLLAASFTGLFIMERTLQTGHGFKWFSRAVSEGIGAVGVYRILQEMASGGELDPQWIPSFLGVQQASCAPVAAAWTAGRDWLDTSAPEPEISDPIEPCLVNFFPDAVLGSVRETLSSTGGDMITITRPEFDEYALKYAAMLEKSGVALTKVTSGGRTQFLDRAGLLAGSGVLKAIHSGRIRENEPVLLALTSGCGPRPSKPAKPEQTVPAGADLSSEIARLGALYLS